MTKKCLDCNEPLSGRIDKKFCSDQCRNNFNNRQNSDSTNFVRNISNILRKNRRIMAALVPEDKITVHKNKLNELGFNFNYFTNLYTTKKGTVYYFCFEYGYLPVGNDFYALVLRNSDKEKNSAAG